MRNNLIYQTFICTDNYSLLPFSVSISKLTFQNYAESIGCNYFFDRVYTNFNIKGDEYFQKLRIFFDPWFDRFDKVLYVDSDVVPLNQENIFDQVKCDGLSMLPERCTETLNTNPGFADKNHPIAKELESLFKNYKLNVPKFEDGQYEWYNAGVILTTKKMRVKIRELFNPIQSYRQLKFALFDQMILDESYLAVMFEKYKIKPNHLDEKWNWTGDCVNIPNYVNFIHYSGVYKNILEEQYMNFFNRQNNRKDDTEL